VFCKYMPLFLVLFELRRPFLTATPTCKRVTSWRPPPSLLPPHPPPIPPFFFFMNFSSLGLGPACPLSALPITCFTRKFAFLPRNRSFPVKLSQSFPRKLPHFLNFDPQGHPTTEFPENLVPLAAKTPPLQRSGLLSSALTGLSDSSSI